MGLEVNTVASAKRAPLLLGGGDRAVSVTMPGSTEALPEVWRQGRQMRCPQVASLPGSSLRQYDDKDW